MQVPAITYLAVTDVQANTLIADLKTLDTASITILIQTAEDLIDAFVGPQEHHWKDTNSNRVFPRVQDVDSSTQNQVISPNYGQPIIPYKVSLACLRQVEWLFTQWWSSSDTDELPFQQDVESVDIGGDGSLSQTFANKGADLSAATLSPIARAILGPFRSRFAAVGVSDPLSNAPVRRSLTSNSGFQSATYPLYPV